jgi:autotransporter-associated beta strand protein
VLDYSLSPGSKLSDTTSATNVRGGTLILSGNASSPVTETVTSFGLPTATSTVQLTPVGGQALTFNLNGIGRSSGQGVADFRSADPALGVFQTTTTNNFQGLLGPYATFNGDRFATVNAGALAAVASTVQNDRSQWESAQNVVVDGALAGALRTTAINSLVFDAAAANTLTIDNGAGALNVRSGGVLVSANVGANNTAIAGGRLELDPANGSGAGDLVLTNRSAGTLTVSASIGANSGPLSTTQHLTLAGSGLIEVTSKNLYSGGTSVHGNVRISGGNAFSDFTQLTMAGGGDMTANGGALLNLNGTSEGVGPLSGGAFPSQGPSEIQLGTGGLLTINGINGTALTYNGLLTGSGTVIKRGGGTQILSTNAQAFTGELHVLGGLVDFTGNNGGVTGVNRVLLRGGSLLSEQNQGASVDKIANGATVRLEGTTGNGLRVTSNQNATRTEGADKLELGAGANVLTLTNTSGGSTGITVLNFANATDAFSRSNNSTLLARGGLADFGGAATTSIRVTFASGITGDLVGGGGAAGTTNISILPFAVGGAGSITNAGDTFLTVGTNGLRPLNTTTEYTTNYATATPGDNLSVNATVAGLAGKTVNSVRIDNSAGNVDLTGTGGTGALNVASGALLVSAGANANATVIGGFDQLLAGASDATPDELIVHVTTSNATPAGAAVTLNSPLADNGAAPTSLTKSGNGTLILGTANSYSGTTTINQGTLQFSAVNQLGADGAVRLAGGTLQWGAGNTADVSAKADTSARTIELIGPSPFLSHAGNGNILNVGNRIDIGANNVTLANAIGSGGVGGLTKTGTGTLTLSVSPDYSGPTLVREGAMNFATIAAGTTPALYLVADAGAVSSTVSNGLNLQSLIVGAIFTGTNNSTGTLTVNGGAVNIGDGSGDDFVLIGFRDGTAINGVAGTTRGTVNFQNASSVNINVGRMILGQNPNSGGNSIDGDLTLSNGTNTVIAHQVIVGNSVGPGNESAGTASSIALGTGTTVFAVDSLTVGGLKTNASMTLGAGGNFTLRGMAGGSSGANVFIGDNDAAGTNTNQTAALTVLDLSAGTADVKANLLVIGRHAGGGTGGGSGKGTLLFNAGTIEAQTIQLAVPDFRGNSTSDASTVGIITQGGGTLRFRDLSKGNGTATYNWNAGTISNAIGLDAVNQNVTVGLLTAAPHTFSVDAGRAATFRSPAGFSGIGSLTKSGNGTLILEGASTFAGGTSVEVGTLLANNAAGSALGTGPISVSVAGTLGGTGSVSGAVTVAAGGTLAPGASIESLGTGALTMDDGSTFALEIDTTNLLTDLLASSGSLTLDLASSPTLTLADLGGNMALAEGTVFPFLTYSSWNGGFFSVGGNPISDDIESFTFGANEFAIDYDRDGNSVALVVVPEPSAAAMLLGGLAAMVGLRRRRSATSV